MAVETSGQASDGVFMDDARRGAKLGPDQQSVADALCDGVLRASS